MKKKSSKIFIFPNKSAFSLKKTEVFDKNTFKRKSDDLTAFVKKMSFCKGEKRTKYLKTFGIESWSSLPSKEEHTLKCKVCVPVPHLFKEPTKKRSKKNKHNIKTPCQYIIVVSKISISSVFATKYIFNVILI